MPLSASDLASLSKGGDAVKNDSGTTVAGLDATLTVYGGSRSIVVGTLNPTWRPSSLFNYTVQVYITDPLSVNTVAVHRANLMSTLGVHKAAELVLFAVRKGLVA